MNTTSRGLRDERHDGPRRRRLLSWLGVGLLAATAVCLLWIHRSPIPDPRSLPLASRSLPLRFAREPRFFFDADPADDPVLTAPSLLPVEGNVNSIALDPRRRRLYTSSSTMLGPEQSQWILTTFDADRDRRLEAVSLKAKSYCVLVGVNPVTGCLYFHLDGRLAVLDGDTRRWVALPGEVVGMGGRICVDEQANRVCFINPTTQELVALDGRQHKVLQRIEGGDQYGSMAIDPATHRLYHSQRLEHKVLVIDTRTYRVRRVLPFPSPPLRGDYSPVGLALDPSTGRLFVAGGGFVARDGHCKVYVLDAASGRGLGEISTGHMPAYLALNPETRRLFVTHERDYRLFIVDMDRLEVVSILTFDDVPRWVVPDPQTSKVYVLLHCGVVVVFEEKPRG